MNPVSGALTRRVAAAILALSLSAPAVAAGDTVTLDDLFGADRWRLVSVTYAGETITFAPDAGAEFVVSELGQLAGTAGCNRLVGTAALGTDGQARFHPVASTLMACPEPAMSHERAFVQALEAVERYEVGEGQVRFLGPGVEVVFVPVTSQEG
jgi:heat shock protein HslJ